MKVSDTCVLCNNVLFRVAVFFFLLLLVRDGYKRFKKNDDVSLISFKTFHDGKKDLYPTITMCFYNPFLELELEKYGSGINITSYSKYLQGHNFDNRMKNIFYDNVTVSLEYYLLAISGKLENKSYFWLYDHENKHKLSHLANNPPYYISFRSGLAKCFSFDIPFIDDTVIWSLFIKIKASIFPNGVRPRKIYFDGTDATEGGFTVSFHYPRQRYRSNFNNKYHWPIPKNTIGQIRKEIVGYDMQFRIRNIEVLNHRNKREKPCNSDWSNDDPILVQKMLNHVGCIPPQLAFMDILPICNDQLKILEAHNALSYPTTDDLRSYETPCREIRKLQYEYSEYYVTSNAVETDKKNWSRIRIYFPETSYKYIEQVRIFGSLLG